MLVKAWLLLQVLASEAQQLLEAATRLLLVTHHTSEGAAAGLKLCIAAASQIGTALRSSQDALDKALNTPTLTSGECLISICAALLITDEGSCIVTLCTGAEVGLSMLHCILRSGPLS